MTVIFMMYIHRIMKWCSCNKLTVNREKAKLMLVSPFKASDVNPLKIDDIVLSSVSHYGHMGMLLDNILFKFFPSYTLSEA